MRQRVDITGRKFARLTAIERLKGSRWKFECECGGFVIQHSSWVKNGNTKSCGCLQKDQWKASSDIHSKHPLYMLWCGMKARCDDENHVAYPRYGGKGIRVCQRWMDFEKFIEDVDPRPAGHSLDRLNNGADYRPGNTRWATPTEQSENTSRNKYLEFNGVRLTVSQWSRQLGIDQRTLNRRRYLGWSDEEIITTGIGDSRC